MLEELTQLEGSQSWLGVMRSFVSSEDLSQPAVVPPRRSSDGQVGHSVIG